MGAELIAHSDTGFPISGGASKSGTGIVWGVYEMTSTEDDDWIEISDFDEILFASCKKVTDTGTVTDEPVTIHTSTTNRLVFTGGSTNTIRVLVAGTKSA